MKLKYPYNPFIILSFVLLPLVSLSSECFSATSDSISEEKKTNTRIQAYIQYNYNWSTSTNAALRFGDFYNYYGEPFDKFRLYEPLLENLNKSEGVWTLQSTAEIGLRNLWEQNNLLYGFQLSLTKNRTEYSAFSDVNGASAELVFKGNEWRSFIHGTMGCTYGEFSWSILIGFGVGFNKDYSTELILLEDNGIETRYENDNDFFLSSDWTLGWGTEITYNLTNTFLIGLRYQFYNISTSSFKERGSFDPNNNSFLSHTVGINVSYQFHK